MTSARYNHTATLLQDGRVLVVGGYNSAESKIARTEIYDPETETWSDSGDLNKARDEHSATLLPDGRVLVVGGRGSSGNISNAEVFSP
jgi:N-acetylneuraminic acid mutarotase